MENIIESEEIISDILKILPQIYEFHNVESNLYQLLKKVLINEIERIYINKESFEFGEFGEVYIPYISFGAINTKHLFGLDELIIFTYYHKMKNTYKTVVDLGANIGLHSSLMSKCFNKVISFEPDEYHYSILKKVIERNSTNDNVLLNQVAISNIEGELEFTRVKGNTTGSHISGSKEYVYGEIDKFNVKCTTLDNTIKKYSPDFIKMDIEGQEKNVLLNTNINLLLNVDLMIEVSNEQNAIALFDYFKNTKINLFSQKNNWKKVTTINEMPYSYKDGSLFMSSKEFMSWK